METTATHILDTVIGSGTACVLPSIGNPTLPHCLNSDCNVSWGRACGAVDFELDSCSCGVTVIPNQSGICCVACYSSDIGCGS